MLSMIDNNANTEGPMYNTVISDLHSFQINDIAIDGRMT